MYHVLSRMTHTLVTPNAVYSDLDSAKRVCESYLQQGDSVYVVEVFSVNGQDDKIHKYIAKNEDESWDDAMCGIIFSTYDEVMQVINSWKDINIEGALYGLREIPMQVSVVWGE